MKKPRLSSQARKAFRGRSRGFTLIEVTIAIALLGIIGVAILTSLSTATTALIIADRRATAESLARTQMEYVKDYDYQPAPNGGVGTYEEIADIPYGYTIWSVDRDGVPVPDVIGIPWDSGNNTAEYKDKGLQKVTVIVRYDIVGAENEMVEREFTLEGYKRKLET